MIRNFHGDLLSVAFDLDLCGGRLRVAMHIRQAFLKNTEKCNFHGLGQPRHIGRQVEGDRNPTAL